MPRFLSPACRSMPCPVSFRPARCVGDECCTSLRQNTHITETRVVLYAWHPWHGRTVAVFNRAAKNEGEVLRCSLEAMEQARPIEVPQWMFDPAACCRMHLVTSPAVNCEALLELKRLLARATAGCNKAVLQAQHHSLANPGGADATHAEPAAGDSIQLVSSSSEDVAVVAVAIRSAAERSALVGATAAPLSRRAAQRHGRKGGGR
jgi:hypothetical protein